MENAIRNPTPSSAISSKPNGDGRARPDQSNGASNNARPFLYGGAGSSGLTITTKASASNIAFQTSMGPLGVFVSGGWAVLDADGDITTSAPAQFTVSLPAGRYYLDNGSALSSTTVSLSGKAAANLPVAFPLKTNPAGAIVFDTTLNNIAGATHLTQLPSFSGAIDTLFPSSGSGLTNFNSLTSGWDGIMPLLDQALNGKVFGMSLPLIGNQLGSRIRFIKDLFQNVQGALHALSGQTAIDVDQVKQALYRSLGPNSGLGWLQLTDANHDGTIDWKDIIPDSDASHTQFNLPLHQNLLTTSGLPFAFDSGLPALGLEASGNVQVQLGFDWTLGLGISKDQGVYLATGPTNGIKFFVTASLPGFEATGHLGFLQVDLTDSTTTPSSFTANVNVALNGKDANGADDGRLTVRELASGQGITSATLDAGARADINLKLKTSFNGSAALPSIWTDFHLGWGLGNADAMGSAAGFGSTPQISFGNVMLDPGTFFQNTVGAILGKIQNVLKPVQPVIDFLTAPLPVLSDLSGHPYTMLDLADAYGHDDARPFIEAARRVTDLYNRLQGLDAGGPISLGTMNLPGSYDPRTTGLSSVPVPSPTGGSAMSDSSLSAAARQFMDDAQSGNSGMSFPILNDPKTAFGLLLGQNPTLFQWTMPKLEAAFDYFSPPIPIYPPFLSIVFGGRLSAAIDFGFGFDTSGLRRFAASHNMADVFSGFYVDQASTYVELGGRLVAGAEAGYSIAGVGAEAGVAGGLFATVDFRIHDPNGDGKLRGDEIAQAFSHDLKYAFDINGKLSVGLYAYAKIGLPFPLPRIDWESDPILFDLLDFSYSRNETIPGQATPDSAGVLKLSLSTTSDNVVNILPGSGSELHPDSDPHHVVVASGGYQKDFYGVASITGTAGSGNDLITVQKGVSVPVSLDGGAGNDTLAAGDGPTTLIGGAGNDCLTGGSGDDRIYGDDTAGGGTGNDLLVGGNGNDTMDGGGGTNSLDGQGAAMFSRQAMGTTP